MEGKAGDREGGRQGDGEEGKDGGGEGGRQGDGEEGKAGDREAGRQGDGETGRQRRNEEEEGSGNVVKIWEADGGQRSERW